MRISLTNAGLYILAREPFTSASGNLTAGMPHLTHDNEQHIPQRQWHTLRHCSYVVLSYDIPIAWYHDLTGWHMLETRSNTVTGKHQDMAYKAVGELVGTGPVR